MTGETIPEPAQEVPLLLNVDIVVVGGGTTGPLAAIAAALAIRTERSVRDVNVGHVQELVQGTGAPIKTHQLT